MSRFVTLDKLTNLSVPEVMHLLNGNMSATVRVSKVK